MTKIRITVTQDDINKGAPHNPLCCPIARAIGRKIDSPFVSVKTKEFLYFDDILDEYLTFEMSDRAQEFVKRFDSGESVKPFTFYANEVASHDQD